MSSKRSIGDSEYLKKRIPQNPKYQHVKSRLDTGLSLTKYMERLEEIKRNYRYKKDELFKRLKVTTFAQLVLQVASVSDLNESIMDEVPKLEDVVSDLAEGDHLSDQTDGSPHPSPQPVKLTDSNESSDTAFSPRSTLQSVISGVGELDLDKDGPRSVNLTPLSSPCAAERPYPDCPYLLLDVRDRDLYDQCHIISAHNYPIATLARTMNPYTKEVLNYVSFALRLIWSRMLALKSYKSSIIELMNILLFLQNVMYLSKEERIILLRNLCIKKNAGHIEQVLQIKTVLLSFSYFSLIMLDLLDALYIIVCKHLELFEQRNVQGKIIILYDEDERIASQAATTMCERGFENLFMLSGGLKVIAQKFPEGMTTGSFPVACLPSPTGPSGRKHAALRQTAQPAENKWRFTSEDLNKIQYYLEEVLIPSESSSRLSSRMSTSSANSKVSSARSSRLGSGSTRSQSSRPWK